MTDDEGRRQKTQGTGLTARQEYWVQFYWAHWEDVRRYLARYVKRPDDVDELMQRVFLHLIVHPGHLQNPRAYLFASARCPLSAYGHRRRRNAFVASVASLLPPWWIPLFRCRKEVRSLRVLHQHPEFGKRLLYGWMGPLAGTGRFDSTTG